MEPGRLHPPLSRRSRSRTRSLAAGASRAIALNSTESIRLKHLSPLATGAHEKDGNLRVTMPGLLPPSGDNYLRATTCRADIGGTERQRERQL